MQTKQPKQNSVSIQTIDGIGDIQPGDDLAQILISAMDKTELCIEDGDILVIAQKVVSKAEDRFVALKDVSPSAAALELAKKVNKDPINAINPAIEATFSFLYFPSPSIRFCR